MTVQKPTPNYRLREPTLVDATTLVVCFYSLPISCRKWHQLLETLTKAVFVELHLKKTVYLRVKYCKWRVNLCWNCEAIRSMKEKFGGRTRLIRSKPESELILQRLKRFLGIIAFCNGYWTLTLLLRLLLRSKMLESICENCEQYSILEHYCPPLKRTSKVSEINKPSNTECCVKWVAKRCLLLSDSVHHF